MIFEVCKNRPKIIKVRHSGAPKGIRTVILGRPGGVSGAAGRGGGLKTFRLVQKSAEKCKELGIRKVVVKILRNVEGSLARQLLAEARGGGPLWWHRAFRRVDPNLRNIFL